MKEALVVAIGGALGSLARWGVGRAVTWAWPGASLPWPTTLVNVLGCFALGVLAARVPDARDLGRLALGTGVLGGFTTFSAFGLETAQLLRENPRAAALHVALNLVLGVGAAALGWALTPRGA